MGEKDNAANELQKPMRRVIVSEVKKGSNMNIDPASEIRAVVLALRVIILAITLVLAGFNALLAFSIEAFHRVMIEAMPGKLFSDLTVFVIQAQSAWMVVSVVLPVGAILVAFFAPEDRRALLALAMLMVVIFIQAIFTLIAMFYGLFPGPPGGMQSHDQGSAFYQLLEGDGLSTWIGYLRLTLISLAAGILVFFFWRYVMGKDRREISN